MCLAQEALSVSIPRHSSPAVVRAATNHRTRPCTRTTRGLHISLHGLWTKVPWAAIIREKRQVSERLPNKPLTDGEREFDEISGPMDDSSARHCQVCENAFHCVFKETSEHSL
jgi:hypothetical protein